MICPICGANARDADLECPACGESLTTWAALRRNGESLRQRGLAWAARGDHIGALVSFLESALANPLDEKGLLDAARALVVLGKPELADKLLIHAAARPGAKAAAEALREAIRTRPPAATAPPAVPERVEPPPLKPEPTVPLAAPVPASAASSHSRPPAPRERSLRALLALGPLPLVKPGWGGKPKPLEVDRLWMMVLEMEHKAPSGDWTGQPRPLAQAMFKIEGLAPIHYAFGLGHWQGHNSEAALHAFQSCIDRDPPVLGPYAYYLCLLAGDAGRLANAAERLRERKKFGKENLDACLAALDNRLKDFGEPELHRAISRLRGARVA